VPSRDDVSAQELHRGDSQMGVQPPSAFLLGGGDFELDRVGPLLPQSKDVNDLPFLDFYVDAGQRSKFPALVAAEGRVEGVHKLIVYAPRIHECKSITKVYACVCVCVRACVCVCVCVCVRVCQISFVHTLIVSDPVCTG
jgi:hypothetical protein